MSAGEGSGDQGCVEIFSDDLESIEQKSSKSISDLLLLLAGPVSYEHS